MNFLSGFDIAGELTVLGGFVGYSLAGTYAEFCGFL